MGKLEDRNVIYHGSPEDAPESTPLKAGELSAVLEGGDLRYVKLGSIEIVRRIYVAVRDQNWNTIPPVFSNWKISIKRRSFMITFEADHRQQMTNFHWEGSLCGNTNGSIIYCMHGEARSNFLKSRIGICVLHPLMECVGQPVELLAPNGSAIRTKFPYYVLPKRPFVNLAGMKQKIMPGVKAELRFAGDIFETEDQRNWSDGSFKTYSTPLDLAHPVEVKQGQEIVQSVKLVLSARSRARIRSDPPNEISIDFSCEKPLPRLGLCLASHGEDLTEREVELLRQLSLSYLRVDLDLAAQEWRNKFEQAALQARLLGTGLEIAVYVDRSTVNNLECLRELVESTQIKCVRYLIFDRASWTTTKEWLNLSLAILKRDCGNWLVGGGTDTYFESLNMNRESLRGSDIVSFPISPQVHSSDSSSLFENLEAQFWVVRSARQFAGRASLSVSPVTLRPRFNPDVTSPEPQSFLCELPPQVDCRQVSLLGACWTAGSLKAVASAGAHTVTYYETTGWRGVMETEGGSSLPDKFWSRPGQIFPLYHVLADFGEFVTGRMVRTLSTNHLKVDGLTIRKARSIMVLVWNQRPSLQRVKIRNIPVARFCVRRMNSRTVQEATTNSNSFRFNDSETRISSRSYETQLLPFEVIRIDFSLQ